MNFENVNTVDKLPLILKVEDIKEIFGISKARAYDLCHNKKFPSVIVGEKRIIIPKPAFIKWLENPELED